MMPTSAGLDLQRLSYRGAVSGAALSWSGGKDSALALRALRDDPQIKPAALITTVTSDYGRVSMHGVRRELVRAQADAAGLPLIEVDIPAGCTNAAYEARLAEALKAPPLADAKTIAFADLFLEDIRAYRETWLRSLGRKALFPIWGRETKSLAREFIAAGFEAVVVCVDPRKLDQSFAGRKFDESFLADLPGSVDPCGENGEFHTFVYAGPIFDGPIEVTIGSVSQREGFAFCDLTV